MRLGVHRCQSQTAQFIVETRSIPETQDQSKGKTSLESSDAVDDNLGLADNGTRRTSTASLWQYDNATMSSVVFTESSLGLGLFSHQGKISVTTVDQNACNHPVQVGCACDNGRYDRFVC